MLTFVRAMSVVLAMAPQLVATSVRAQPDLGVAGLVVDVGLDDDAGFGLAQLDTAVTPVHGLQLDLGLIDYNAGAVGQIAAHAYMMPTEGQKYGLFAVLGDADERSRTYGTIGIEGLFSIMPNTTLGLGGGIGLADPGSWDFIYLDAGLSHAIGPGFRIDYGLTLTEIDEEAMDTIGTEARIGIRYAAPKAPWGAFAEARYDELDGDDDTTFRAGLSFTFGRGGGFDPEDRMFRTADPLGPLFRRGQL
ncbi:hypothetical protein [Tropicimonas sp. S265A]|uniref:hypothetical protein n=1 Tax=Tropicimonas sp. S265A TaxID=3415134 RepID=UPI003C7A0F6D